MTHEPQAEYLVRFSLKAIILNHSKKVLVVKESGRDFWDLPGGGIDRAEDIKSALARELYEEVGYTGDFTYSVLHVEDPAELENRPVWQARVIYVVNPENMNFRAGDDGDEIKFVQAAKFKDSQMRRERQIYEYVELIKQ